MPNGKSIKVIAIIQVVIIIIGMLVAGMEIRMWKLQYPFEIFERTIPPPGLFRFLADYGFFLFIIPLSWAEGTGYLNNFSTEYSHLQMPFYYGGYVVTIILFLFIAYSLVIPWSSAPHGITM